MNAIQHTGKASSKAVMNKVMGELKGKIDFNRLSKDIDKVVKSINKLDINLQVKKLKDIYPKFFEAVKAVKKNKDLPPLDKAIEGKVILRFAPSPSGPLHIGHTYPLLLNALYKEKYAGKLILRIEDTNPANIYKPAYEQIVENAKWVTNDAVDEVHMQSDRMRIYYQKSSELIESGFAYVCTCLVTKFKEYSIRKTACPCRSMTPKEHMRRWKDMFLTYQQGEAAVRIKTDVSHKNPAIREWVAFRISEGNHSRQGDKYRVWPTMNFAVAVDDHEMKLTHIIHGKDHEPNAEKQRYIFKYFRWKHPERVYIGRINFKGMKLSTTRFKQEINSKTYTGWDDVRLPTLFAFKRRGIQPEALARYVKETGPSKTDKTVNYSEYMKTLYKFNKDIIDPEADRYYFVPNPIRLWLSRATSIKVIELKKHPDHDGIREVKVSKVISIPRKDFEENAGKEIRLKGLCNIKLSKRKLLKHSRAVNRGTILKAILPKIQWVAGMGIKTEVLMPDGRLIKGIAEKGVSKLEVGEIIQFERFGFVKLEKKTHKRLLFVFTHN